MISLPMFLECVDIDSVVFEINKNQFFGKELYQYYYSSEINTMKISKLHVNQNDMIMAVIEYD